MFVFCLVPAFFVLFSPLAACGSSVAGAVLLPFQMKEHLLLSLGLWILNHIELLALDFLVLVLFPFERLVTVDFSQGFTGFRSYPEFFVGTFLHPENINGHSGAFVFVSCLVTFFV